MKVLFLCTGNSARSQMAEAIFNREAQGVHTAISAGSHPKSEINPYTIEVLKRHDFDTEDLHPKHMNEIINEDIDLVITLCDKMKEHCPTYPNKPIYAHFGFADPAAAKGTEFEIRQEFNKVFAEISNRIELFLHIINKNMTKGDTQTAFDHQAKEAAESAE